MFYGRPGRCSKIYEKWRWKQSEDVNTVAVWMKVYHGLVANV